MPTGLLVYCLAGHWLISDIHMGDWRVGCDIEVEIYVRFGQGRAHNEYQLLGNVSRPAA
jgi:hypothetical protein